MNFYKILFQTILIAICAVPIVQAQIASGGSYTLNKSVIASGGGSSSDAANSVYNLTGTAGEPVAGATSTNMSYSVKSGFYASNSFVPTAAAVSISGRVITAGGKGIRNVLITMIGTTGATRTTSSGSFGFFSFAEVPAGEVYILTATAKRYSFEQPTQIFSVVEDINTIVFTGNAVQLTAP